MTQHIMNIVSLLFVSYTVWAETGSSRLGLAALVAMASLLGTIYHVHTKD